MKKILCLVAGGALALLLPDAHARPVSYPGGWTAIQANDGDVSSLHLHYSPDARYSIGYRAEYWHEGAWQFHGGQVNYLLHRWNRPHSQANAYLMSGIGLALDGRVQNPAAFAGFSADWETRRYFVMYEGRYTEAGSIGSFAMQKARVGVAPYIGDYGDVHTWLMLQLDHMPERDDGSFAVTPMVRLFKDVYMAEFGVSHRGDAMLNWTVRF